MHDTTLAVKWRTKFDTSFVEISGDTVVRTERHFDTVYLERPCPPQVAPTFSLAGLLSKYLSGDTSSGGNAGRGSGFHAWTPQLETNAPSGFYSLDLRWPRHGLDLGARIEHDFAGGGWFVAPAARINFNDLDIVTEALFYAGFHFLVGIEIYPWHLF